MPSIGRLHVITTRQFQDEFSHAELAKLALLGGADVIQFRDKDLSKTDALAEARKLIDVCSKGSATALINDHVDLALILSSEGVHLGQNDLPIKHARRLLGPSRIIGATAPDRNSAMLAEQEGADYIGVGPVFSGNSKEKNLPSLGLKAFQEICRSVSIPVIGIGGIKLENAASILDHGGHGIAVMTAICCATDPEASTRRFVKRIS